MKRKNIKHWNKLGQEYSDLDPKLYLKKPEKKNIWLNHNYTNSSTDSTQIMI
jgi:hypothetical protein